MKYAVAVLLGMALIGSSAWAQQNTSPHVNDNASFGNQKAPKSEKKATARTVTGLVTDESGQALAGALVTLTDKGTNERTSFFTKKDGRYQFEDVSFHKDYEVQARYKSFASEARKVSQYDTLPRPVRMLEIDTHASDSHAPASTASNQAAPK